MGVTYKPVDYAARQREQELRDIEADRRLRAQQQAARQTAPQKPAKKVAARTAAPTPRAAPARPAPAPARGGLLGGATRGLQNRAAQLEAAERRATGAQPPKRK